MTSASVLIRVAASGSPPFVHDPYSLPLERSRVFSVLRTRSRNSFAGEPRSLGFQRRLCISVAVVMFSMFFSLSHALLQLPAPALVSSERLLPAFVSASRVGRRHPHRQRRSPRATVNLHPAPSVHMRKTYRSARQRCASACSERTNQRVRELSQTHLHVLRRRSVKPDHGVLPPHISTHSGYQKLMHANSAQRSSGARTPRVHSGAAPKVMLNFSAKARMSDAVAPAAGKSAANQTVFACLSTARRLTLRDWCPFTRLRLRLVDKLRQVLRTRQFSATNDNTTAQRLCIPCRWRAPPCTALARPPVLRGQPEHRQ